jgi:Domain of unknown function (DUF4926)
MCSLSLSEDLPDRHLRRGDVATVVEHLPGSPGQEPGYTLEVFNAVGETVDLVTVRDSQIQPLTAGNNGSLKSGLQQRNWPSVPTDQLQPQSHRRDETVRRETQP